MQWRIFSAAGTIGDSWRCVSCGIAQGCPLSPLLSACVMALWTCFVEQPGDQCIRTVSFVDDRLMWSSNPAGAAVAKERSDLFDQAFFLSYDAAKTR